MHHVRRIAVAAGRKDRRTKQGFRLRMHNGSQNRELISLATLSHADLLGTKRVKKNFEGVYPKGFSVSYQFQLSFCKINLSGTLLSPLIRHDGRN